MAEIVTYPIGDQNFRSVRENGFLYVDKTRFIQTIVQGAKYIFLARPRRFGKSLFLSTLEYFFRGERGLFKGLAVDSMPWDWEEYPVLRLDFNSDRYAEEGRLEPVLDRLFREWEAKYVNSPDLSAPHSQRFADIIKYAHEKTGRQVVILVDEYDKALVTNLNQPELYEHYRSRLQSLYSNFKGSAEHIRLVFITGVSRFGKLSIFSDINNINDISFDDAYADICGITQKELEEYFREGIRLVAEYLEYDTDETLALLKRNYDGYRFSANGSDIYNPWSVLNCMQKGRVANYWNDTGFPTVVAKVMEREHGDVDLQDLFDTVCTEDEMKGMSVDDPHLLPVLYQTGYLTIKEYMKREALYRLGIPNNEVRHSLMEVLLPFYSKTRSKPATSVASEIVSSLKLGLPDKALKALQNYFAGISYTMRMDNENNFHNALYIILSFIGASVRTEQHTSDGRIDLLVETPKYLYVIELKYDRTAEDALRQIDEKNYARPFSLDGRTLFKIGVSFSSKTRTIEDWKIEREE